MTVYLAGAGLTKSLQQGDRVPLMMDFVQVLTEFTDNDVVLATLVKMELGEVYERSCDECRRLAEDIGRDVQKASRASRAQFARSVRSREPESIEMLLERSSASKSIYGQGLPTDFRYAINQVFATIGWDLRLDVLIRFLRRQFEEMNGKHVFVSFTTTLRWTSAWRKHPTAIGSREVATDSNSRST